MDRFSRVVVVGLGLSLAGCNSCRSDQASPAATGSAQGSSAATASAVASSSAQPTPSSWPVPVGPRLAILPGKGVGAIRFGATIPTIERLMEFPCEIKTETLCGYNGRAVEFTLSNGALSEIHVHRVDRVDPDLAGAKFGVFNGRLLNGASLEMLQPAAQELLGDAQRVEQVKEPGLWGTVERHHYAEMTIEYDRLTNGNVVLGGIVLKAPSAPAAAGSAAPAASSK